MKNRNKYTKRYAIDIDWDTDGQDDHGLPDEVQVPDDIHDDDVADYLSDTYGFCVFGLSIVEK